MATDTKTASVSPKTNIEKGPGTQSLVLILGEESEYLKIDRIQFLFNKVNADEQFRQFVLAYDPNDNAFWMAKRYSGNFVKRMAIQTVDTKINEVEAVKLLESRKPSMIEIYVDRVLSSDVVTFAKGLVSVSLVSDSLWQSDLIKNHDDTHVFFNDVEGQIGYNGPSIQLKSAVSKESK